MNEKPSKVPLVDTGLPVYEDPTLLQSQIKLKLLTDEMLKYKPSELITFATFEIPGIDPKAYMDRIRASSLGDVLLSEGASLSIDDESEYFPDLGLAATDKDLIGISIRAWGWVSDKYRVDPQGPKKPPYNVLTFPGEKDWGREVDIRFVFGTEENYALESLSSQSYSQSAGNLPSYSRQVIAPAYAESGYEGHNQEWRQFKDDEEAALFYDLVNELFEIWKADNSAMVEQVKAESQKQ